MIESLSFYIRRLIIVGAVLLASLCFAPIGVSRADFSFIHTTDTHIGAGEWGGAREVWSTHSSFPYPRRENETRESVAMLACSCGYWLLP